MRSKRLLFLGAGVIALTMTTNAVASNSNARHAEATMSLEELGEFAPTCAWPSVVWLAGGCTGVLVHPEIVMYASACGDTHESAWFGEVAQQGGGREVAITSCEHSQVNGKTWAFCRLADPVSDVPIVPIGMGCEHEELGGTEMVVVGFSSRLGEPAQKLHALASLGTSGEAGPLPVCEGSDGGPVFTRLDPALGGDGSWRLLGVSSGAESCNDSGYQSLAQYAVPWIEGSTELDVSPCHFGDGQWGPSEACRAFPLDPGLPSSSDRWPDGCADGPMLDGWGESCGPPFDDQDDFTAPRVRIASPEDNTWFPPEYGRDVGLVDVVAEVEDDHSGVLRAQLRVDGVAVDGPAWPSSQGKALTQWTWPAVELTAGSHVLAVSGEDHAGNYILSASVVVNIGEEPTPSLTSGESDAASSGTTEGGESETTGATLVGSSTGEPPGSEGIAPSDAIQEAVGCSCGTRPASGGLLPLLLGLATRRRRSKPTRRPS